MAETRDAFEAEVGALFARHADAICRELCEGVRGARASHPRLMRDVQNAAFCVAKSETFRRVAAASRPGEPTASEMGKPRSPMLAAAVERLRELALAGSKSDRPDYGGFVSTLDASLLLGEIEMVDAARTLLRATPVPSSAPSAAGPNATDSGPLARYGVRRCRGHWHVTSGGEDIVVDGEPFATLEDALAVADKLNCVPASAAGEGTATVTVHHGTGLWFGCRHCGHTPGLANARLGELCHRCCLDGYTLTETPA